MHMHVRMRVRICTHIHDHMEQNTVLDWYITSWRLKVKVCVEEDVQLTCTAYKRVIKSSVMIPLQ